MRLTRAVIVGFLLIVAAVIAYQLSSGTGSQPLDQSSFYAAVSAGQVEEVTIAAAGSGYEVRGRLGSDESARGGSSATQFTTYVLEDDTLSRVLRESGVRITARKPRSGLLALAAGTWIWSLLVLAILVFLMRRMHPGEGRVLALMRSRARRSSRNGKVTFKDVAGAEEAKRELQEIVEFLRQPDKFRKLGGEIPTGVLLMGPPGTGKTLLARAVAGEADVPFYSVSGSDFVEMFVGIGASRVRDLFEEGRKNAPCIVFVDEIDAVGRQRGAGVGGGHDEREQSLNQLLVELDGFEGNGGVIVLAATNRPDVLDPALLRPGRFDRQIVIDLPDVRGREEIIKIHARGVPLNADVELGLVARGTPGFSGAALANLVNEAALHAAGLCRETVRRDDFEHAKDKGLMGSARRSLVVSDEERCGMAYRQAGHALLAHLLPEADSLHKVTIIPRGRALGTTQQIPTEDRHTASRPYLLATICCLMGGRVAEELQHDRRSSGAGEDFERATTLAHKMVTEWGMSASLGPLAYGKAAGQIFLGKEIAQHRDYSNGTATAIDREVRKIVMECYDEARRILGERPETLIRVAEALLVHETLTAEQVATLARGEALPPVVEPSVGRVRQAGPGRTREVGETLPMFRQPGLRPA